MAEAIKKRESEKPTLEVFPENHKAVDMILRLQSQWVNGGLNYTSLFQLMDIFEVEDKKDCFDRVQFMEYQIIDIQNSK